MVEKNNNIPDTPDKKSKNLHLGEDFEKWLKGRERQKNFLTQKNHLDARSQLADLKESLGGKKSYEKISKAPLEDLKNSPSRPQESVAFTEQIQTSQAGDDKKNALHGFAKLITTPLMVLVDGAVDGAKVFGNPRGEFVRTVAYLKEESSAKII